MCTTVFLKPSSTLVVRRALAQIAGIAVRAVAAWQRQRRAQAVFESLNRLDARTLRDLGIDRSELASVTGEIVGRIEPQRARGADRRFTRR